MALKFSEMGYEWQLREGFPPMGSSEDPAIPFEVAIRHAVPFLAKSSPHEIASWVVARLAYLTSGALDLEGDDFSHDTNEIGYKTKAKRVADGASASGAIVITSSRTYFAFRHDGLRDFQAIFVAMLSQWPNEYAKCVIRVREPESNRSRLYGWDGYSLRT